MITDSEVVGSMDKKNIFDTTASTGTFFTMLFGGWDHELLQFSLL